MVRWAAKERVRPVGVALTHAHVDHIAGLWTLHRAFSGLEIVIHELERDWLTDARLNLSALSGLEITGPEATRVVRHGDEVAMAGARWAVLHTPGHSPGGVTFHSAGLGTAFVGDALFAGSIGRTDFPGCSFAQLERSIRDRLYTLPDETRVLPGHGPETTIGREKRSNPFVRA